MSLHNFSIPGHVSPKIDINPDYFGGVESESLDSEVIWVVNEKGQPITTAKQLYSLRKSDSSAYETSQWTLSKCLLLFKNYW